MICSIPKTKARFDALDKEDQQIHGEFSSEVKIFAVKIAEKIITICQGDLIMNRSLLDNEYLCSL
jgi:hypothetical protein